MKKIVIFLIVLIIIIFIFAFFNKKSFNDKLKDVGYNSKEVDLIIKNVAQKNYNTFLKKYNKSLINIISSKDYKEKNFDLYIKYYDKNSNEKISNIISIVNSGYDVLNYPASNLLANLVKEKYFINKNISRYLDYGNNHDISSKKIVAIVNAWADYEYYSNTNESNLNDDELILVNKFNYLPNGYVPKDLVTLSGKYNKGVNNQMRKNAAEQFMKMVDGALLDNIVLKNASSYRSYEYQVNLYNKYAKKDGKAKADIYSARPGYSEHQTGLCTDINTIDSSFALTNEAKWLKNNAYKYGFILRFPEGKEDITGYKYEPWHYRYVGVDVAKKIYENDLTLEEYYAYYIKK